MFFVSRQLISDQTLRLQGSTNRWVYTVFKNKNAEMKKMEKENYYNINPIQVRHMRVHYYLV